MASWLSGRILPFPSGDLLIFLAIGLCCILRSQGKKKEIYIYMCVCVLQYGKIYKHIVGYQAIKQVTNSIHWAIY